MAGSIETYESTVIIDRSIIQDRSSKEFVRMTDGTVILPVRGGIADKFNLDRRIKSEQDPYQIIDIAHISVDPLHTNIKGRLSISISPGKKDVKWNRNLVEDLMTIKENGINIIVCLLEWSEMKMLGIADYPRKAQDFGLLFYHLPIRDRGIPQQGQINALVPQLVQHLANGLNILVHCREGLGRAGTICACCLGHFGYEGKTAIEIVRKVRPGAVQTSKQAECVSQYCRDLSKF